VQTVSKCQNLSNPSILILDMSTYCRAAEYNTPLSNHSYSANSANCKQMPNPNDRSSEHLLKPSLLQNRSNQPQHSPAKPTIVAAAPNSERFYRRRILPLSSGHLPPVPQARSVKASPCPPAIFAAAFLRFLAWKLDEEAPERAVRGV
jgi:hypothetical protein